MFGHLSVFAFLQRGGFRFPARLIVNTPSRSDFLSPALSDLKYVFHGSAPSGFLRVEPCMKRRTWKLKESIWRTTWNESYAGASAASSRDAVFADFTNGVGIDHSAICFQPNGPRAILRRVSISNESKSVRRARNKR